MLKIRIKWNQPKKLNINALPVIPLAIPTRNLKLIYEETSIMTLWKKTKNMI